VFDKRIAVVAELAGLDASRSQVELHWTREDFKDEQAMRQTLGRERMKDVAVDCERMVVDNRRLEEAAQAKAAAEEARPPPARVPVSEPATAEVSEPRPEPGVDMTKLAQLEDAEVVARRDMRMLDRYSGEKAMLAFEGRGPAAKTRAALQAAQGARVKLEAGLRLQPRAPSEKVPIGQTPHDWLMVAGKREERAHKLWAEWRDAHTLDDQREARLGRGPGAQLCADFREARLAAQGASITLRKERERGRALVKQLGLEDPWGRGKDRGGFER
jgi:hypothetical protein